MTPSSPESPPFRQRPLAKWLILLVAFSLYGLYRSSVNVLYDLGYGHPINWTTAVGVEMWSWLLWLAFLPFIFPFAKRFPLEKRHLAKRLLLHLGMMTLVSLLHIYLWKGLEIAYREQVSFFVLLKEGLHPILMFTGLINNFYKYAAIVGLFYLFDYVAKYRQREKEAADLKLGAEQLQRSLTQAKLDALTMQLNPHFLFNSLNTISVFMEEDLVRANDMLVRLSELLRETLQIGQQMLVPLEKELALVGQYLEIEQIRFEDRLQVFITHPESHQVCHVPPLILQPIAENAIRHGIAKRIEKGEIYIHCEQQDHQLIIRISDNGPGLEDSQAPSNQGIGLQNVRARLKATYGDAASFCLTRQANKTVAQMVLPASQGAWT